MSTVGTARTASAGKSGGEYGVWTAGGGGPRIECRVSILRAIHSRAVDRFLSIPRGGVEIGGVLFGIYEDDILRIEAYRELEIEYASGPSFLLSPMDRRNLRQLLDESEPDPELADLHTAGFYLSHTRSDLTLREQDESLFEEFPLDTAHAALVIRPHKFEPVQFNYFVRGGPSGEPFTLDDIEITHREAAPEEAPEQELSEGGALALATVAEPAGSLERPSAAVVEYRPLPARPGRRTAWLAAAACLPAVAVLAALLWPKPDAEQPIAAAEQVSGPTASAPVPPAQSTPALTPEAAAEAPRDEAELRRMREEVERLRAQLKDQEKRARVETVTVPLAAIPRGAPQSAASNVVSPPRQETAPPPPPPAKPVYSSTAEIAAQAKLPAQDGVRNRDMPQVQQPSAISTPTQQAPQQASQPPAAQQPAVQQPAAPKNAPQQSATPQPTAVAKPRAGRAIWIGELRRGDLLSIDGARASSGTLTGQWFEGPARIRATVGEFGGAGLQLYTSDERQRNAPVVESPSARNGWNLTTWMWDAKRSRDLSIVELPSSTNGFRRVLLRNSGKTASVIVLDWEALP